MLNAVKPENHARRGFTLIELLVVVAVVALLIGLLLPAAGRCVVLSRQAREQAAAQSLMVAYTAYSGDARGAVPPGYPPAAWVNAAMVVTDSAGERLRGEIAQRYPWRLAPYLDFNFRGLYKNERTLEAILALGEDTTYVLSLYPSLGLNSVFVGGSDNHLAFNPRAEQLFGKFYVSRLEDAHRPSELITFVSARAEAQALVPELGPPPGFFRVEPPYFTARSWQPAYEPNSERPGLNSGYVSLRYSGRAVVGALDGHAESLGWEDLQDMRRWANGADRRDWLLERR